MLPGHLSPPGFPGRNFFPGTGILPPFSRVTLQPAEMTAISLSIIDLLRDHLIALFCVPRIRSERYRFNKKRKRKCPAKHTERGAGRSCNQAFFRCAAGRRHIRPSSVISRLPESDAVGAGPFFLHPAGRCNRDGEICRPRESCSSPRQRGLQLRVPPAGRQNPGLQDLTPSSCCLTKGEFVWI